MIKTGVKKGLTRLHFPANNSILHLSGKLNHRVNFRLALLAFLNQCLEFLIHGVFAFKESIDQMLFDRETRLDRFLSCPIFAMSLAFHKDLRRVSEACCKAKSYVPTVFTSMSPYHRSRMASAPSVFSNRPRYNSSSSLSKYIDVMAASFWSNSLSGLNTRYCLAQNN